MEGIDLSTHLIHTHNHDVNTLCEPLQLFGITYFTLDRIYADGSRVISTNRSDWIQHYYAQGYYEKSLFDCNQLKQDFVLWAHLNKEPVYAAASEHNISHGITLIFPHGKYYDFCSFGFPHTEFSASLKLIENIAVLIRFYHHFIDQSKLMMKGLEKSRIILPNNNDFILDTKPLDLSKLIPGKAFARLTKMDRFFISNGERDLHLTKREIDCLAYLSKGYSIKQIAYELNIGYRTTEEYLGNIKKKFGCKNLCQLGIAIERTGLLDAMIGEYETYERKKRSRLY
jgi:DNA-binding CsgD family transcriptional regulator